MNSADNDSQPHNCMAQCSYCLQCCEVMKRQMLGSYDSVLLLQGCSMNTLECYHYAFQSLSVEQQPAAALFPLSSQCTAMHRPTDMQAPPCLWTRKRNLPDNLQAFSVVVPLFFGCCNCLLHPVTAEAAAPTEGFSTCSW